MNLGAANVCEDEVEVKEGIKCGIDVLAPSAFTISDKALEKITKKKTTGEYGAKEAIIAQLEEKWLSKERCLEEAHANKWKYSKEHFDELEQRLLKTFEPLQPCPTEEPLMECYKRERKSINCRDLVLKYISCIEDYVAKTVERLGAVSCVKTRPKPKDFHH